MNSCDCKYDSNDWVDFEPISGKRIWNDGTVYEGDFKNFLQHGIGTITYPDGEKEAGRWKND